jgi:hypothetical protein
MTETAVADAQNFIQSFANRGFISCPYDGLVDGTIQCIMEMPGVGTATGGYPVKGFEFVVDVTGTTTTSGGIATTTTE